MQKSCSYRVKTICLFFFFLPGAQLRVMKNAMEKLPNASFLLRFFVDVFMLLRLLCALKYATLYNTQAACVCGIMCAQMRLTWVGNIKRHEYQIIIIFFSLPAKSRVERKIVLQFFLAALALPFFFYYYYSFYYFDCSQLMHKKLTHICIKYTYLYFTFA